MASSNDAKLEFGEMKDNKFSPNESYNVKKCRFHFERQHQMSFPDGNACCESIELTVEVQKDLTFFDWYLSGSSKEGRVKFKVIETGGSDYDGELYFDSAYCYSFEEAYQKDDQAYRILKLGLVADTVTFNDNTFE